MPKNTINSLQTDMDIQADIQSIGDLLTNRQRKRFKAGDSLLGRYRILGELGQGGMGLVFRCLDEVGGIEVAVKMLPPEVSHDSGEMEDVRENFRLVSSLVHQNICAVRTLEKDPATGEYFLVMELAQGVNLRQWRKLEVRSQKPEVRGSIVGAPGGRAGSAGPTGTGYSGIPLDHILPIIRQIASALDYAHAHKVIHRDIKPSNVMVDAAGQVKVLDFGLAAQIHTSFSRVSHVRYGTSGTGPYMAPEQWEGQYQDAATDQYALAVLTYELLTGYCPFESHEATVLRESVLKSTPKCPPGLAPTAWAALQRALAKEREGRFASCGEFARALGGERISPQSTQRAQRSGRAWKWAAGIVVLAGLAAGGWGVWRSIQESGVRSQKGPDGAGTPSSRETVVGSGDPAALAVGQGDYLAGSESETAPGSTPRATGDEQPSITPAVFGWVEIQSSPAGATIWIGTNTFPAGREVRLPAGDYQAVAKLAGYYDATVKVAVSDTHIEKADVALAPHRGSAKLSSTPSRARIWLGDRDLGLDTPEIVPNLPVGRQVFTLKKEGYRDGTAEAVVKVDDMFEASATLVKRQGWLWIKAEGLDGKTVGTLAIDTQKFERATLPKGSLPLSPGTVAVEYRAANGQAARKFAPVEDGKTNTVVLVFGTGPQEGLDWEIQDLGMLMKWITPGEFGLGSTAAERTWAAGSEGQGQADWYTDEGSQPRRAAIRPGFWLGQTEVTVDQWRQFIADTGYRTEAERAGEAWAHDLAGDGSWKLMKGRNWKNPGFDQDDRHPVVAITWNDATNFCGWLTRKERAATRLPENLEYRLPSEAEWEYACRGGKDGEWFWWGSRWSDGQGRLNCADQHKLPNGSQWSNKSSWDDGYAYTAPVGNYGRSGQNGYGLQDMLGNVWEWCLDGYSDLGAKAEVYLGDTSRRVVRGGSFNYQPGYLRCAYRVRSLPSLAGCNVGFRVGLGVPR